MKGIVVTGGDFPPLEKIVTYLYEADCIIAADSGLDTLIQYGFEPQFVVGDMDSVRDRKTLDRYDRKKIVLFPEDKDFTDTELALELLGKQGCSEQVIIGGGGGRLDHLLGIYSLFSRKNSPDLWITEREKIFLVKEKFCINLNKGDLVSFFPVGNEICRMKSTGLKWPLDQLTWTAGDGGISNVALEESLSVTMKSGRLIMILSLDNPERYGTRNIGF